MVMPRLFCICTLITALVLSTSAQPHATRRFALADPLMSLRRDLTTGAFYDVVGRWSAVFGYEGRPIEAWVYPLKVMDQFQLSFQLEGFPLAVPAAELRGTIEVRPEATILTTSHAAFTVRQIIFAPIDEPALVILLDVDTTRPMTVIGSFRPALRPMWPASASTPNVGWDASDQVYELTEDRGRFAGIIGIPGAVDRAVMPYQEEPRDVPLEFAVHITRERAAQEFVPIVIAAAAEGRDAARAIYSRVLPRVESLYRSTADHYGRLLKSSVRVSTPEARLTTAFDWALVGMDKGLATNPALGTGLLAGFRTSGNSERPGFAWFFGRDALWTSLALGSAGAIDSAHAALEFLAKYQRADGKIPHEISQSAALVPWFADYPYAWASADATPLYVIGHADAWRVGGDRAFLSRHWPSIQKAYQFSAATDSDRNGLIDNTNVGHGWVEGGALYPPHEEIYLQGLWIEASRSFAEMASEMGDRAGADAARAAAERTRAAVEATYWLADRSFYAFATGSPKGLPHTTGSTQESPQVRGNPQGPPHAAGSPRGPAHAVAEDTVLPAVPMWWRTLDPVRADAELDHLGSAALATDWGHRILSERSTLYDPLSYHYGSVWPLFTGWASVAAYRYGRPHIGYQALVANALLTESGALGYVTELLSGEFNAPFGRSSHHQIWSEAMIVSPLMRGLLGVEALEGGKRLRIAPQLPADWDRAAARGVMCGGARFDLELSRTSSALTLKVGRAAGGSGGCPELVVAPAFPLDAQIDRVSVNGAATRPTMERLGDMQFVEVSIPKPGANTIVEFRYRGGSDVYTPMPPMPRTGARSEGLRVLRSRADAGALKVLLEGLNGRTYDLFLRTSRIAGAVQGASLVREQPGDPIIRVTFEGEAGRHSRREITVQLR